jgi:hypothetical protein
MKPARNARAVRTGHPLPRVGQPQAKVGAAHHAKVSGLPKQLETLLTMASSPGAPERQLKHRRSIDLAVYARGDGLWEVEARLIDTKTRDFPLAEGMRPAGEPIHDLGLHLVVDTRFNVLEARALGHRVPYPGHCDDYRGAYERLVGLNLMQGFRQAVRERLGGVQGCTHLTELCQTLPTAVIQAFAGEVFDTRGLDGQRPFQLDRCHALRTDGEAVRIHYPRWYRPASRQAGAGPTPITTPADLS